MKSIPAVIIAYALSFGVLWGCGAAIGIGATTEDTWKIIAATGTLTAFGMGLFTMSAFGLFYSIGWMGD